MVAKIVKNSSNGKDFYIQICKDVVVTVATRQLMLQL